jgi:hypothetical protein
LAQDGEYLGDFGLVEKWPSGLDDCLLRNPLIVAGPGIARNAAPSRCGRRIGRTSIEAANRTSLGTYREQLGPSDAREVGEPTIFLRACPVGDPIADR